MLSTNIGSAGSAVNTSGTNLAVDSDAAFHADADNNIAIGTDALDSISGDGDQNIAIGLNAGTLLSTGDNNILIGAGAGDNFDAEDNNIGIGTNALGGGCSASSCIAIGTNALDANLNSNGNGTIAIGYTAGTELTTGGGNLAIGYQAMLEHTTGGRNIAIGFGAMNSTQAGGTQATSAGSADNVFIGKDSGGGAWADTASAYNVAVGNNTLVGALDASSHNTVIGYNSGNAVTTGDENTLIGRNAGLTINTGSANTCIGAYSGDALTGGGYNTAIGNGALGAGQAVYRAVAIGYKALFTANEDTSGGAVAIGYQAAYLSNPADADPYTSANTIIGYSAGFDISASTGLTTGIQNTAVGHESLGGNCGSSGDITGDNNTCIGYRAGYIIKTSSTNNTFVGALAGDAITTGSHNTIVGRSCDGAATQSYQTILGYNATTQYPYDIAIGANGGIRMATARITLSYYDSGNSTDHAAAYTNAIIKVPAYSFIRRIWVTILTLSAAATHLLEVSATTSLSRSAGQSLHDQANFRELVGASADDEDGVICRSQDAQTADSDINVGSGATNLMTWVSDIDVTTSSAVGWCGAATGIYLANAGTGNPTSDAGADAQVQISVEYHGLAS
jgi:hypothetical protein